MGLIQHPSRERGEVLRRNIEYHSKRALSARPQIETLDLPSRPEARFGQGSAEHAEAP